MRARTYASEALARAAVAAIDAVHGYPRLEPSVHRGGGRHLDVVTITDHAPIRLRDGSWAVRSDRLALASISTVGDREVRGDVEDPADVRKR